MIIPIIIEIVLGTALLVVGSLFWDCAKSPRLLADLLGDYGKLLMFRPFLHYEARDEAAYNAIFERRTLKSIGDPNLAYPLHIAHFIKASLSSVAKVRNMLLLGVVGIVGGSCFLGLAFSLINMGLFFLLALRRISNPALGNVQRDVHMLMRMIAKWNAIAPVECRRFCSQEQPRMLEAVYKVVAGE